MMKKWHLIGIIKRIVNMKRWDRYCFAQAIWISAHLLDKFLTLGKRNGFLLLSFNRNFRTFYLSVEGTHVREISKIFWISAHLIVPLTWRSKVLPFDNKN